MESEDKKEIFHTEAGYAEEMKKKGTLTPAAEDYLEMIYRIASEGERIGPVRICDLASRLSVSPSSASRMAQSMAVWGYVDFKRYGYITLTEKGCEMGKYLIQRHRTVVDFLVKFRGESGALGEAERIEHYLSRETVDAMEKYLAAE